MKMVKVDLHMNSQLNVSVQLLKESVAQKFVTELREQMESGMQMAVRIPHTHDCVSEESCNEQLWINPDYIEVIGMRSIDAQGDE